MTLEDQLIEGLQSAGYDSSVARALLRRYAEEFPPVRAQRYREEGWSVHSYNGYYWLGFYEAGILKKPLTRDPSNEDSEVRKFYKHETAQAMWQKLEKIRTGRG